MEHRVVLSDQEALEMSSKLKFLSVSYVVDEYTGKKRIRRDETGKPREKDYETPVKGVIHRFSASCTLGEIEDIWFEFKWTNEKKRFEIEFEGEVPEKFKDRENIGGWDILR